MRRAMKSVVSEINGKKADEPGPQTVPRKRHNVDLNVNVNLGLANREGQARVSMGCGHNAIVVFSRHTLEYT